MNKIEDLLHKEIANIIVTRIDNPQIKNTVTITDIKVSKDIRSAVVYFVTLDKNFRKIEKIINELKPTIKFYLSKNVYLKRIPDIKFIFDDTAIKGQRISKLLDSIR
ncbi:MAG: 30S ribosome-binding factor RbfA [Pseudomonadota bacterium]|nr:30S ribosome-binding factor RbfA [Pseudomonadota bacterium]